MADDGAPTLLRKSCAREAEDDEAAAATSCAISSTFRVAGLVRMSLVNAGLVLLPIIY